MKLLTIAQKANDIFLDTDSLFFFLFFAKIRTVLNKFFFFSFSDVNLCIGHEPATLWLRDVPFVPTSLRG